MRVRFWGTRGSIASAGPDTVRYGGNTSCVEVRTSDGTLLILDAGTGIRALGDALLAEKPPAQRGHIFITHTHWDHIQGFPFFVPLFVQGHEWHVYAPRGFGRSLKETLAGQMQYTYFPITLEALGARMLYHDLVEGSFTIGEARITAHYLNHPALTLGYRIEADGATVVYATDHECYSRTAAQLGRPLGDVLRPVDARDRGHAEFIAGADLLIHDTQYTAAEYPAKVGWGHSTVEYVVDLAAASGVKQLALFHHDPRRKDAALDALVQAARERVGTGACEVFAASEGQGVELGERAVHSAAPASEARVALDVGAAAVRPILIACADASLADQLRRVVEAEGIHAVLAGDAASAMSAARAGPLALAFVERRMGSEDGLNLCRALHARKETADLPLVVVSRDEEPDESAQGTGATDWLVAPFTENYARTRLRASLLRTRARWMRAPRSGNEDSRLRALHDLQVLDTPREERFDHITRLAARVFDVPFAVLTLVDRDRQWFKSSFGFAAAETSRDQSFCAHAIQRQESFVVPDALQDDRFADNPAVTGDPHVRFYAGHPIAAPDGNLVGTLCVFDQRPRELNETQLQTLRDLASLAQRELCQRDRRRSSR